MAKTLAPYIIVDLTFGGWNTSPNSEPNFSRSASNNAWPCRTATPYWCTISRISATILGVPSSRNRTPLTSAPNNGWSFSTLSVRGFLDACTSQLLVLFGIPFYNKEKPSFCQLVH